MSSTSRTTMPRKFATGTLVSIAIQALLALSSPMPCCDSPSRWSIFIFVAASFAATLGWTSTTHHSHIHTLALSLTRYLARYLARYVLCRSGPSSLSDPPHLLPEGIVCLLLQVCVLCESTKASRATYTPSLPLPLPLPLLALTFFSHWFNPWPVMLSSVKSTQLHGAWPMRLLKLCSRNCSTANGCILLPLSAWPLSFYPPTTSSVSWGHFLAELSFT